jgi:hypothetical protein
MSASTRQEYSEDNHALLLVMGDKLTGLSKALEGFIETQGRENLRINERIDHTNAELARAQSQNAETISNLKDIVSTQVANYGKMSSGDLRSNIAVLISMTALVVGSLVTFISMRIEPFRTDLDKTNAALAVAEGQRIALSVQTHQIQVETAREDARGQQERLALRADIERLYKAFVLAPTSASTP